MMLPWNGWPLSGSITLWHLKRLGIGRAHRRVHGKNSRAGAVVGKVAGHLCRRRIRSEWRGRLPLAEPFVVEEPEGPVPAVVPGIMTGPPTAVPKLFWVNAGLLFPARLVKKSMESRFRLRMNSYTPGANRSCRL